MHPAGSVPGHYLLCRHQRTRAVFVMNMNGRELSKGFHHADVSCCHTVDKKHFSLRNSFGGGIQEFCWFLGYAKRIARSNARFKRNTINSCMLTVFQVALVVLAVTLRNNQANTQMPMFTSIMLRFQTLKLHDTGERMYLLDEFSKLLTQRAETQVSFDKCGHHW